MNRLPATGEIDDAQPPHAETDPWLDMNAFIVRPAMPDDFAHPVNQVELAVQTRRSLASAPTGGVDESGYSTHDVTSCSMHG